MNNYENWQFNVICRDIKDGKYTFVPSPMLHNVIKKVVEDEKYTTYMTVNVLRYNEKEQGFVVVRNLPRDRV